MKNAENQEQKRKCLTAENETAFVFDSGSLDEIFEAVIKNRKNIQRIEKAFPDILDHFDKINDRIFPFSASISAVSMEDWKPRNNFKLSEEEIQNYITHRKAIWAATQVAKKGFDDWRPSFCETDLEFSLFLSFDELTKATEDKASDIRRFALQRRYRNENDSEIIVGNGGIKNIGIFMPTTGRLVNFEMFKLLENYKTMKKNGTNPIELAAHFNAQFVRIQPFLGFNKRLGLIAANFILAEHNLPSVFFDNEDEPKEYIQLLYHGIVERDLTPLTKYFAEKVVKEQQKTILFSYNHAILEGVKKIFGEKPLSEVLNLSDTEIKEIMDAWEKN